jgi:hypothetical protein
MCYHLTMASSSQPASTRTVVLLRSSERKRLEKLAAAEHVSSGEILRRSLHAYEKQTSASENEALATLLNEMNTALDGALASIRSARSEIHENLQKIQAMKEAQA